MFRQSEPVPVVGVAPDASPTICIEMSSAWVPVVIGLAEFMLWRDFWSGTVSEVDQAVSHAVQLIGLLAGGDCPMFGYVKLKHLYNGSGGASVAGWQTRVLNTAIGDTDLIVLSSNQFTPVAGRYIVCAHAPALAAGKTQLRLWDVDGEQTVINGIPGWTRSGGVAPTGHTITLVGSIITDGTVTYELQHYCEYAYSPDGLGVDANSGIFNEYATVELTKIL